MSTEQLPLLVDGRPCRQFWFSGKEIQPGHFNGYISYYDGLIFFRHSYFLVYCETCADESTTYVPFPPEWLDENLSITWGELKNHLKDFTPKADFTHFTSRYRTDLVQYPDDTVIQFTQKPDDNRMSIRFPWNRIGPDLDRYLKQYE